MADEQKDLVKPITTIGTAHRLEDGRVLVSAEDHQAYEREIAMQAAEDVALAKAKPAAKRTTSTAHGEGQSDG